MFIAGRGVAVREEKEVTGNATRDSSDDCSSDYGRARRGYQPFSMGMTG